MTLRNCRVLLESADGSVVLTTISGGFDLSVSALPDQTGHAGEYLTTNGTVSSWSTPAGAGDVSSNTATSVDGEMVLFNSTTGKSIKRSTLTGGMLKSTSGVPAIATAGTDYTTPSSTEAFTNKTFNANGTGNSISNIEIADFAASAIVTAAEGTASSDNDTSVPTTAAVIDAIAAVPSLSDGDKGDITVSASGATWTIDSAAVSLAKMANIATDSLIGRDTAGTGVPEAITLATSLEFSGSGTIRRSALTGDVTASAGSNATTIANDAVTYAKIQNVSATDRILGRVSASAGDVEEVTFTDQAQQLCDDTSFGAMRTTLGVAIGSDVQAYDASLTDLSSTWSAADNIGPSQLAFFEDTDNGTNKTILKGESSQVDAILTLPNATDTLVGKATSDVFTNKTFDANGTGNSISNLEVADFAGSAIVTAAETLASSDNDTSIPTTAAVIDAIAAVGGISDGDKGDITVSSGGTVWTVDNDVVTYAKMQNVSATDRLLGRDTAAAGDVEELTASGGIEFTGTGIQTSAFTGDVTKTAGGTALTIPNDTVTYAKMQNISATDRLLGRDTAAAGDAEELTVGGGIEFTGTGGIQTSAFTGDVTKSAGGTATTIASAAVSLAKMANIATDTLIGRDTAASGVPEAIGVTGGIVFSGSGSIQTTAFTGDVTKTLGGTALTIANDAVTYAKMQNISATDRILGRSTAGSGDTEEIVCTATGRSILDDASVTAVRTTLLINEHMKSLTLETPAANDKIALWRTPVAITIISTTGVIVGGTNVVYQLRHGTDYSAAGADTWTANKTVTSTTTGDIATTTASDVTCAAGEYIWLFVASISGVPTQFHLDVLYSID